MLKRVLTAFLFLFYFFSPLYSALPEKPLGAVSDFAGILNPQSKSELESIINGTRQKTSAEIAVVTVSSLDGMTIEEYANKLFNQWGIGKKDKDNGVLVLVAPNDRQVRIEVGYGLEPILPDGLAGQIIREEFVPEFKAGDYSSGIINGVARIVYIITGEKVRSSPLVNKNDNFETSKVLIILFIILIIIFQKFYYYATRYKSGRFGGGGGFGGGGFSGGGGFGGFGGGSSGGGGASGRW